MVHQLVKREETEEQRVMFALLDKNGDGMLQRQELLEGMRTILGAVEEHEVDEIF